jgi:diguanylate cyclase (GGDEF)-like protein/PAS domain S-box-containing protein
VARQLWSRRRSRPVPRADAESGALRVAEEELRHSEQRFRALVQHASELMIVWDRDGKIIYASPATVRFATGTEPDEYRDDIEGTNVFLHEEDLSRVQEIVLGLAGRRGATERFVARYLRHDGQYRSLAVTVTNLLADPAVRGIVANSRDVTEATELEHALGESEAWFRSLVQHGHEMIVVLDRTGGVRYFSPGIEYLTEAPDGTDARTLARRVHPADRAAVDKHFALAFTVPGPQPAIEMRALHTDGSWRWLEVKYTNQLDDPVVQGVVINLRDITERKEAEALLAHQALHDPLTGLPNRALLVDRLRMALGRAERNGSTVGVLFLDLDRFKLVNDAHGHGAGDTLLAAVALRLQDATRRATTIARFGADEFVFVCEGVAGIDDLREVADQVCSSLEQPFDVAGHRIHCSASAGIALSQGRTDSEVLLREADAAMYAAKAHDQGSRIAVFDTAIQRRVHARVEMERALREALERDELRLEFQPIVSLRGPARDVVSAEALLRWAHPEQGTVGPSAFIDLADETGLIVPIGAWVIDQAVKQVASWRRNGSHGLGVAVNVSATQLRHPDLPAVTSAALERWDVPPDALTIEITESSFVEDTAACAEQLDALKEIGVRIVLDDFGVRYSSFGYLNRMPLDGLKIDRIFVQRIGSSFRETAIVSAILLMAQALGLDVVAEGVETSVQDAVLTELGCTQAQGFLYARPGPPDDLLARVRGGGQPSSSRSS